MRVCVVHDVALDEGGGLRIARVIADELDADFYVGMSADGVAEDAQELFTDPIGQHLKENGRFRGLYYLWRFQDVPQLRDYDVVLMSGNGTDWYVPRSHQSIIKYVHNPAPMIYSRYHQVADSRVGRVFGIVSRSLRRPTFDFPTKIFVNSEQTQEYLQLYLDQEAEILPPPVDISGFYNRESEGYFLILSRLTKGKRILDTIEEVKKTNHQLVVCGSGPLEDEVKKCATGQVEFQGWVTEPTKKDLLARCKGLIMPSGNESFGIAAVEAFASGKPVWACQGGHLDNLVIHEENGFLYSEGRIRSYLDEEPRMSATQIESVSERYNEEKFRNRIRKEIDI